LGNTGNSTWKFLISPSDADSVIGVGAVNSAGIVGSFSAYGPSSDGQVKPDMVSVGVSALIQIGNNTIAGSNGTSFACPNMAGLATCLWQGFPEYNNIKIIRTLQKASHKFSTPDDRFGYGIADMKLAFADLLTEYSTSSSAIANCKVSLSWNSKDVNIMKYEIERKGPAETVFTKIGEVIAQGGAVLSNKSYNFVNDLSGMATGNYSYRIRQIIDTASASFTAVYIDTTTINSPSDCIVTPPDPVNESLFVRPNPATSEPVSLIITTPYAIADLTILVFDGNGSLVIQMKDSKAEGEKIINLPVNKLSKGKYYIKVMNGQKLFRTAELLRL
jgi:subtilisin family serine protease